MLKVAVGVIKNVAGDILISKRSKKAHQGGLWEFPGGKFEANETCYQALSRELKEELGIDVQSARPLIKIPYHYEDKSVLLDVLEVNSFTGNPVGLEGQPVKWVSQDALENYSFPAANKVIIDSIKLSNYYPIVDACLGDEKAMLKQLEKLISNGYTQIQLRAKNLTLDSFLILAEKAITLSKSKGVRLFVNTSLTIAVALKAEGVHLDGHHVKRINQRVIESENIDVAFSCHTAADIALANRLKVTFIVLSPVCKTQSHIDLKPLGWDNFEKIASEAAMPVYALGGVDPSMLELSYQKGAQGVSGIRGF